MAPFASPALAFTRDGRRLVVVEHDAVLVTDIVEGSTRTIDIDRPRDVIGFVDQIWIAHGRLPMLSRFGVTGAQLAPACELSSDGELIAAAAAAPAAVWTGTPALSISDDGGLRVEAAPAGELVLPLTARRWIVANGQRVTMPSGLSCELGAGARVLAGAVVFDASAIVVLVERPSGRELVVIGLANGRPQLRLAVAASELRLALRRGVLAVRTEPEQIAVIDLRSGRTIGRILVEAEHVDFTLDTDGQRIALRGQTVEVIELRDAMERTRARAATDASVDLPAEPVRPPPAVSTPAGVDHIASVRVAEPHEPSAATQLRRPLELDALQPITHVSTVDRAAALELLDREMRNVALWTLCAISAAWDSRRIGYGNEGQHPFEHEVAALLGMNAGFARDHVAAARKHLAAHEAASTGLADPRGDLMPLGVIARELGLSPLALDILLVIAAPTLWSDAARLYGILANDPGRGLVDEALAIQILAGRASRHDIAAELDPRAPLVRFGIVSADARRARPFAALAVDPVIVARLRRESPDLGAGVSVRGSNRALEELALADHVVSDALAAIARASGPARIAVRGRASSGRRSLLAALAAEAGRALGVVDVSVLPRNDRVAGVRSGMRRAQLAGLMPCVIGLEVVVASEHDMRDALAEVLRAHPGPLALVLSPTDEPPLDPGYVAIELPILAENERLSLWRASLAEAGLAVRDPSMLAARYRIGPGAIHRAIAAARDVSESRGAATDATSRIEQYIRQTRDTRLGAHARRIERLGSWDSVVLPSDIRDSLRELVARVRHRRTVFETWGMDGCIASSRGLTALFSGPPGTGKTLVAGVIARELGLDLYQVELSRLMSKWIGETERHLAAIFDAAEDGQAILLFDEADSLFAKRTEVRSSNDRYANLEVNYLLQRLDSFEGIAILTTNTASAIDPAFKRRMSFRLSFPFPDEETRIELWRTHLPASLPIAGPLALDKLAHKYQLSGGYIRNACLRAAFLAAEDRTPLAQAHLERAVALEFAELGKLSSGGALH